MGKPVMRIAEILIGVGLFKDKQEFYNAVAAAGAEGSSRPETLLSRPTQLLPR
jgi:hypothetical protein